MRKNGRVEWFFPKTGMGVIKPDDGGEPDFIHISSVKNVGLSLQAGQRVNYILIKDGPMCLVADIQAA